MSKKTPRCDACDKKLKASAHDAVLSDLVTGQVVGSYCMRAPCIERAMEYMTRGAALRLTMQHPRRCMPEFGYCADGYGADPAALLFFPEGAA